MRIGIEGARTAVGRAGIGRVSLFVPVRLFGPIAVGLLAMIVTGCQSSGGNVAVAALASAKQTRVEASDRQTLSKPKKTRTRTAATRERAKTTPTQQTTAFAYAPHDDKETIIAALRPAQTAGPVRKRKALKRQGGGLPGVKSRSRAASRAAARPVGPVRGKFSQRRKRLRNLVAKHARANGVPLRLAMAVVEVESTFKPKARGAAGEIGLMQIMPRTARYIGYKGRMKALYNPDTNLRYGMKYLGKAHRLAKGNTCGTILRYNAGHGAKRMNPISARYCKRVARIMRRR